MGNWIHFNGGRADIDAALSSASKRHAYADLRIARHDVGAAAVINNDGGNLELSGQRRAHRV